MPHAFKASHKSKEMQYEVGPVIFNQFRQPSSMEKIKNTLTFKENPKPPVKENCEVLYDEKLKSPAARLKLEYPKNTDLLFITSGRKRRPIIIPIKFLQALTIAENTSKNVNNEKEAENIRRQLILKVLQQNAQRLRPVHGTSKEIEASVVIDIMEFFADSLPEGKTGRFLVGRDEKIEGRYRALNQLLESHKDVKWTFPDDGGVTERIWEHLSDCWKKEKDSVIQEYRST